MTYGFSAAYRERQKYFSEPEITLHGYVAGGDFMNELNGTVAVITGAGRGIGREIALHQAQGGAKVAVLARTAREIDETASLITGAGGAAIAIPVDLVDRLAVEDALARVAGELGAIDLLVNNHGSFRAFGPIWECDPDVWWQDVEIICVVPSSPVATIADYLSRRWKISSPETHVPCASAASSRQSFTLTSHTQLAMRYRCITWAPFRPCR
jgi:NAD(P)-dependent dehydrogenase (short-subunit alcohol dehydrogenase family)